VPNEPRKDTVPDYFPDELPLYQVGQVVLHRRYGYRGVVVDFDMACRAPEDWYARNNTQPERAQPWYHVLVDGSDAATYAAQSSLVHDPMHARWTPVADAILHRVPRRALPAQPRPLAGVVIRTR